MFYQQVGIGTFFYITITSNGRYAIKPNGQLLIYIYHYKWWTLREYIFVCEYVHIYVGVGSFLLSDDQIQNSQECCAPYSLSSYPTRRKCRILVNSSRVCPKLPLSNWLKISRWMDTTHANVLDGFIPVKWANPHAAPHAAHALLNKRGEL